MEEQRQRFKPEQVKILFVGEAHAGRGIFFYAANSVLFRALKQGFSEVYGTFASDADFLAFFQNAGCFLDDLCPTPIHELTPTERRVARKQGVASLSRRIQNDRPLLVVIVMRAIEGEVKLALRAADLDHPAAVEILSFPAGSERNRQDCIAGTRRALLTAARLGIL